MMKTTEQSKSFDAASITIAQSAVENDRKTITTIINIGFILLSIAIVGVGFAAFYFLYWRNRLCPMKYNPYVANSNIPLTAAVTKTNVLYEAMKRADTDEKAIKNALRNVNHNGYVDVYNAFGKRKPGGLSFSLGNSDYGDLISFLHGDFNNKELQDLRRAMAPDAATLTQY